MVESDVVMRIYDILGNEVQTLIQGKRAAGEHKAMWDGKDRLGNAVSSGIYYFIFETGTYRSVRKGLLLK